MLTNLLIAGLFISTYFGLFYLLDYLDAKFVKKKWNTKDRIWMSLMVKNADENIEDVVKTLKRTLVDDLTIVDKLFIIDLQSEDLTLKILEKLSESDDSIAVIQHDEAKKIFDNITINPKGENFEYLRRCN